MWLEQAVAAFGAACSQLALMLARGDADAFPALAATLAGGTRVVARSIARIRSQVPLLPAPAPRK